ncbi:F0F1 ATP synthase subunit A [Carboxylicivirga sp. A043]|uniref:F0F1 ATP synthase subunit A n=1 Tax=Carboxylicivirga litoralis TaxID=2816963 RepID=UPI0021CB770F|nr:F0F1 ATP synthase subunit A [Carboxylicivirga sp. A043]MCU4155202.1 F0F1 ATP synthase subunit A [Carboxylicivirga sp. A043]
MQNIRLIIVLIGFWAFTQTTFAANTAGQSSENEFDPMEMIMHHIADAHEWHVISYKSDGEERHITLPLPVILIDDGLHVFMSSAFHHGEEVVQKGQSYYKLYHGKIYKTDAAGSIKYDEHHEILNEKPIDLSITRNVASMWLSIVLIIWLFTTAAKRYKGAPAAPKGVQSFVEPLILFVRDDIAYAQIEKGKADKFLPFLLTLFFFIWINNLIGLIPFFPGGSNLTGNISLTMVLALITFLVTNFSGSKSYWGHIFWMPGVPVPIRILLSVIEFIGLFTKPFALMIRLLANITAGHIIILSLFSLIFVMKSAYISFVSVPMALMMFMLELLVAVLQAYIFTLLSALFIGMAVHNEEH